jgi:hypothetical protein
MCDMSDGWTQASAVMLGLLYVWFVRYCSLSLVALQWESIGVKQSP